MTHVESVEEEFKRLAIRLEEKRKATIEKMGNKWILHPDNHIQKLKDIKPLILTK